MRGAVRLASGAPEGEEDAEFLAVFGDAGVGTWLPFRLAPAPRTGAAVEADESVGPLLDAPTSPCAFGAGPAPARDTHEHTVQLETASRAVDMLRNPPVGV